MSIFQILLSPIVILDRLAQLNSAIHANDSRSIELLIHRRIRGKKIKLYSLGFVDRLVRVANIPVQTPGDTEWQCLKSPINTLNIYYLHHQNEVVQWLQLSFFFPLLNMLLFETLFLWWRQFDAGLVNSLARFGNIFPTHWDLTTYSSCLHSLSDSANLHSL